MIELHTNLLPERRNPFAETHFTDVAALIARAYLEQRCGGRYAELRADAWVEAREDGRVIDRFIWAKKPVWSAVRAPEPS